MRSIPAAGRCEAPPPDLTRPRPGATLGRDGPPRHRAARVPRGAGRRRRRPGPADVGLGRRAAAIRRPTATPPAAATPPGHAAPSCCRRSTRSRPGSAGSASRRSTTSAGASPSRRPRPTASPRSTRCSRRSRGRRSSPTSATTSPAGWPAPRRLCDDLERALGPAGEPVRDGGATWLRSPCLGLCERAPAALFTVAGEASRDVRRRPGRRRGGRRAAGAPAVARRPTPPGGSPRAMAGEARPRHAARLLARVGVVDPASLDDYRAHGGYAALARAFELGPEAVIAEVTASRLIGRGGAAFPTGRKWAAVAAQPAQPHYLVCNADESEPGTFKDRVLMEGDPFAIVEAMTIAAFATGCRAGYLYLRGEYPEAEARVRHAIEPARGRRPPRRRHPRLRLRLRHRAPARRRRLHLRRGDGALRVDRGQARRAAQQAAVPGRGRAVRQADGRQQRRDAGQRAADRARRRRGLRGDRHRGLDRPEALLPVRPRRAAGRLRGRVRGDAARADRARRRRPGRPGDQGDPARRGGRRLRRARRARHAAHVRGDARDRRDARLGRRHGLRRDGRPGRHAPADRPVLPRRVVRPVRPVPGRHRPAGGAAGPARGRVAASGRATRSSRCCARSARRCATPRSAASARPPRRRSSPRSASPGWWRCDATTRPRPGAGRAARRSPCRRRSRRSCSPRRPGRAGRRRRRPSRRRRRSS